MLKFVVIGLVADLHFDSLFGVFIIACVCAVRAVIMFGASLGFPSRPGEGSSVFEDISVFVSTDVVVLWAVVSVDCRKSRARSEVSGETFQNRRRPPQQPLEKACRSAPWRAWSLLRSGSEIYFDIARGCHRAAPDSFASSEEHPFHRSRKTRIHTLSCFRTCRRTRVCFEKPWKIFAALPSAEK